MIITIYLITSYIVFGYITISQYIKSKREKLFDEEPIMDYLLFWLVSPITMFTAIVFYTIYYPISIYNKSRN